MISYNKAINNLQNLDIDFVGLEKIFITESANRILAEDIIAEFNSPEYKTSSMDGYAIKYENQNNKIEILNQDNPAGTFNKIEVKNGFCIKTFTGSLIPKGADTLIPIENITVENNFIIINEKVKKGFSIRAVGENFQKDDILIKKGAVLSFAEVGVLASLNICEVLVYKKPTVSIISTGSEILSLCEKQINQAQIRSSNNYTLEVIAKKYGANTLQMGIIKDDIDEIRKKMLLALDSSDILVTTGGVSVGDYDFVKDIIKEFNGKEVFTKVNIKPGQHIKAIQVGKKMIFALPGFAYSSLVTFLIFIVPMIKKMQGLDFKFKQIKAILKNDFIKRSKKQEFTPCNLTFNGKNYCVDFENKKNGSSAILTNMLNVEALAMTTEDDTSKKIGDWIDVIIIDNRC